MPPAAVHVPPSIASVIAVQQLLQQDTAHLVHGGTDRHFAGFQVQVPKSLAILEHPANEAIYFFFRFSAKRLCSFFFNSSNSVSSGIARPGRS